MYKKCHANMESKGLTLVELLVVVIIIGIISTIALVNQRGQIENAVAREGEYFLNLIYNAEKRYNLNNGAFFVCAASPCAAGEINTNLNLLINERNFRYQITGGGNVFNATATRISGECQGISMSVTQAENKIQNREGCTLW